MCFGGLKVLSGSNGAARAGTEESEEMSARPGWGRDWFCRRDVVIVVLVGGWGVFDLISGFCGELLFREGFPVRGGGDVDLSKVYCAQDCCRNNVDLAVDNGLSSIGGEDREGVILPNSIVDLCIGGGEGRRLEAINGAGVWHAPV